MEECSRDKREVPCLRLLAALTEWFSLLTLQWRSILASGKGAMLVWRESACAGFRTFQRSA